MYFDVNYYKNKYSDLQKAYGNNYKAYYEHFINWGINEGRASSIFLDVKYYKNKYSDLRKAYGNNYKLYYEHFINWGIKEGRQASASFDVKYYLSQYGDLQKAYGSNYTEAIKHYIYYGKSEGRKGAATANNGGNGNNQPNTPPTNTEYTPTPNEYGQKIIPQKELAKCITKVPITTSNWQDYFELKDIEKVNKNDFGETTGISKYTRVDMTKDKTYYSTTLEFEITNPNLMSENNWNYNNGSSRRKTMTFGINGGYTKDNNIDGIRYYYHTFTGQSYGYLKNHSTNPDIYDDTLTINDLKVNRTNGYVYIFNIPDSFWTKMTHQGDNYESKYIYIETPNGKHQYECLGTANGENYCIYLIGLYIENGTFKDINL